MKDTAVRRWSQFHTMLYRSTNGVVGRRLVANDMLLLTTKGHRTGGAHTVPLLYLKEEDRLVLIASYGGRPQNPTWYDNLVAEPEVTVQIEGSTTRMTARTASPEERAVWWPQIEAAYDGYAVYQSRTEREIPVVFLEPGWWGRGHP